MPFAPRLAFVDVETTGVSPQDARITEIAVVRVERTDLTPEDLSDQPDRAG